MTFLQQGLRAAGGLAILCVSSDMIQNFSRRPCAVDVTRTYGTDEIVISTSRRVAVKVLESGSGAQTTGVWSAEVGPEGKISKLIREITSQNPEPPKQVRYSKMPRTHTLTVEARERTFILPPRVINIRHI